MIGQLEEKLRKEAEKEIMGEFRKEMSHIQGNEMLRRILQYKGQFTILGHQLEALFGTDDVELVEKTLSKLIDERTEAKVTRLLTRIEDVAYLWEGRNG